MRADLVKLELPRHPMPDKRRLGAIREPSHTVPPPAELFPNGRAWPEHLGLPRESKGRM